MPKLNRAPFEQARHVRARDLRPMREADLARIQSEVVAHLDTLPDLLVEKGRRPRPNQAQIDLTATWVGADVWQSEVQSALLEGWPPAALAALNVDWHAEAIEEFVVLEATGDDGERFFNLKVSVRASR